MLEYVYNNTYGGLVVIVVVVLLWMPNTPNGCWWCQHKTAIRSRRIAILTD